MELSESPRSEYALRRDIFLRQQEAETWIQACQEVVPGCENWPDDIPDMRAMDRDLLHALKQRQLDLLNERGVY